MEEKILERLDQLGKAIEDRFTAVESRLDKLEGRLDRLESRMGSLENRMDRLETRMDGLENRMTALEQKVDAGFAAIRIDIEGLSGQAAIIKETVDALDLKMNKVQEFMAYHDAKVLEHDKEIFALKRKVF